jgi:hypothetical protein
MQAKDARDAAHLISHIGGSSPLHAARNTYIYPSKSTLKKIHSEIKPNIFQYK